MPLNTWIPTTALAGTGAWVDSHEKFKPPKSWIRTVPGYRSLLVVEALVLSIAHFPAARHGHHDQRIGAPGDCLFHEYPNMQSSQFWASGKNHSEMGKKIIIKLKKKTIPRSRHSYMMLYACMMWPFQNFSFYVPISATITGICLRWPNNIEKLSQKIPKIVEFPTGQIESHQHIIMEMP